MPKNFSIVNPHRVVEGKSVSEWTEQWWKWVLDLPAKNNPLNDTTGDYARMGNDDDVFFIAGPRIVTINPGSDLEVVEKGIAERGFNVPLNKPVLFPILNALSFDLINDPLSYYLERMEGMYATIDGKEIRNIAKRFDVEQMDFKLGPAEDGTLLYDLIKNDSAAGDPTATYDAGTDGYWLMLDKLSEGKHTLEFGGFFDVDNNGYFNDGDVQLAAKEIINVVKPSEYVCPFDAEIPLAAGVEAEMLMA